MEERNRLLASKDVADVVSRFDEVDIAIVGIGILEPSQLLKTSGNYYHEDMLQVLAARAARWVNYLPALLRQKRPSGVTR